MYLGAGYHLLRNTSSKLAGYLTRLHRGRALDNPGYRINPIHPIRSIPALTGTFRSSSSFFPAVSNMERVNTSERLAKLRELMRDQNVDVYSKLHSFGTARQMLTTHALQSFLPRTLTRPSISRLAMLGGSTFLDSRDLQVALWSR